MELSPAVFLDELRGGRGRCSISHQTLAAASPSDQGLSLELKPSTR